MVRSTILAGWMRNKECVIKCSVGSTIHLKMSSSLSRILEAKNHTMKNAMIIGNPMNNNSLNL